MSPRSSRARESSADWSCRVERAASLFAEGYNCAQAVLAVAGEPLGIGREMAFRLAGAFGGGLGRRGEMCGALVGAMMAIGLKHGMIAPGDAKAKEKTYSAAQQFLSDFHAQHGSLLCRDLLGADLASSKEAKRAREEKLFATRCPPLIRDAMALLARVL